MVRVFVCAVCSVPLMSGLPRKWPSYGLQLFKRRAAGFTPWLVVAAVGAPIDWETLRGDLGVARIGFGPRFPFERGDYRGLLGLDVLVTLVGYEGIDEAGRRERDQRALTAIWRDGRPATLWTLARGFAYRLGVQEGPDALYFLNQEVPHALDEAFREEVAAARETQLILREGVFADPAFDQPYERLVARIARGRRMPAPDFDASLESR